MPMLSKDVSSLVYSLLSKVWPFRTLSVRVSGPDMMDFARAEMIRNIPFVQNPKSINDQSAKVGLTSAGTRSL